MRITWISVLVKLCSKWVYFGLVNLMIIGKRFNHGKSSKCEVVRTSTSTTWVTFLTDRLLKDRKHLVLAGKPCFCHQDRQEVHVQPYLQTYRIYCRVSEEGGDEEQWTWFAQSYCTCRTLTASMLVFVDRLISGAAIKTPSDWKWYETIAFWATPLTQWMSSMLIHKSLA